MKHRLSSLRTRVYAVIVVVVLTPLCVTWLALYTDRQSISTMRQAALVNVFDKNGRLVREFGDSEQLTQRSDLNRFLNIGNLATDAQGHLYYGFAYFPEPTVRQFDRFGYAAGDLRYASLDVLQEATAARHEIEKQERRGDPPRFKQVMTAMGVDKSTGEVWIAMGSTLLRFDKEGNRRSMYRLYTPQNARLEANAIVVEKDRLIIGSDPIGVYEFERLDTR